MVPVKMLGDSPAGFTLAHKYFDKSTFFQCEMSVGHGGPLLIGWLLTLPTTLPEIRCVLLTMPPSLVVHLQ